VLDRLARQRIPLLIITGRHDRVTTPAVAFRVAEALRVPAGGVVTFERSGHRPWAEQPDDFFDRVRGFLSQHQP
jgi:pimeloyl-ACP methyl ester carboxylesterase